MGNNMKVELIDLMGGDLTVVNSARVSFDKIASKVKESDQKLIRYLAAHDHWTPFGHVQAQFRIKAPVFVARQLVKHQVGMVWNETSRRYVDSEPDFHAPEAWRKRAPDKKQGSLLETFTGIDEERWDTKYWGLMETCKTIYDNMIASGVAPEQARMILPQSMMTEWIWTGSLVAFARVVKLRSSPDAQYECQHIANRIKKELDNTPQVEYSWRELCQ
jgi:thymidylate synthase (FAD)